MSKGWRKTWLIICGVWLGLHALLHLLLHLPPLLLCLAWWFVAPSLGLLFSLQWAPCVLMCGDILRQEPTHSPRLRCLLYAVAMLPFAAMLPVFFFAWSAVHG